MAINSEIELETIKAIIKLMSTKAFYSHIIQQFDKVFLPPENKEIETAAVGKTRSQKNLKLFINEGYFEKLLKDPKKGKAYIISVFEHEILHVVLGHLFINFSDSVRGNIACDIVVNQYVDPVHDDWMTHTRYSLPEGKSCFWYYEELKKNAKYQEDLKNGAFGVNGMFSYMNDAHSKWKGCTGDEGCESMVKDIMRKARDACDNSYGNIHGDVKAYLDTFLKFEKEKVPWNRILRLFVSQSAESNLGYTIQKISKRYGTRPGTKQEEVLNVAVTIDTSGSISDEDLVEFFTEIRAIWKNGANVTIIESDCEVGKTYKFKGKFDGNISGRGGTDLEPAMMLVDKAKEFDAHIYFTDFYAPKISKKYKTPVLWVLTSDIPEDQWPYEWGKKVNIRDGRPI
jgi:predicted metal-dependent peptidase